MGFRAQYHAVASLLNRSVNVKLRRWGHPWLEVFTPKALNSEALRRRAAAHPGLVVKHKGYAEGVIQLAFLNLGRRVRKDAVAQTPQYDSAMTMLFGSGALTRAFAVAARLGIVRPKFVRHTS
jgi:hypothetical protein